MIILEGTIINKVIHGARGDFSTGTLYTEEGKFKIKSQLLDPYEEGEYQAKVAITKFELNAYTVPRSGIMVSEILVDIDSLEILDEKVQSVKTESMEPDPSVDSSTKVDKPKAVKTENVKPTTDQSKLKPKGKLILGKKKTKPSDKPVESVVDTGVNLVELFGHLWPLGDCVKQDKTAVRSVIIQQNNYLKQYYVFDGSLQEWNKKS